MSSLKVYSSATLLDMRQMPPPARAMVRPKPTPIANDTLLRLTLAAIAPLVRGRAGLPLGVRLDLRPLEMRGGHSRSSHSPHGSCGALCSIAGTLERVATTVLGDRT